MDILDILPAQPFWVVWENIGTHLAATDLNNLINAHPTLSSCRSKRERCPYCKQMHGINYLLPIVRVCRCGNPQRVCPDCHNTSVDKDDGDIKRLTDTKPECGICEDIRLHPKKRRAKKRL